MRFELITPHDYSKLEKRMAIFHSGCPRLSTEVNIAWRNALRAEEGYKHHFKKMEVAYRFREGLRLQKWSHVLDSMVKYREIRTKLCRDYMEGSMDLLERAESHNCTAFPLGAGGGGGVLLFSPDPESLESLRGDLQGIYREIPFKIRSKGYEINNIL
jgi:galactokinase/mevalonate kinase-like predicted kinase